MDREIKIRLTLDGKELVATARIGTSVIDELIAKASQLNQPMLEQFKKDLLSIGTISAEATAGIVEFIKYNGISEKQIEEVVKALNDEKQLLGASTKEYAEHVAAITNVANAYGQLQKTQLATVQTQKSVAAGSSGMNMLIGQTSFLLSDADMFFVNFRMGLLSIGNNISMVANTLQYAIADAQARGLSFGRAFMQSLTGFNMWLIGINVGMFVIQMLARVLSDTTDEVKKQRDEVDKLKTAYEKLTEAQIAGRLKDYKAQLAEMEAKHPESITSGGSGGAGYGSGMTGFKATYKVTGVERFGSDYENVQTLQKQIAALVEVNKNLGVKANLEKELILNQEKLSSLSNNPDKTGYYKNIIPDAKSFDEAAAKIRQWIEYNKQKIASIEGTAKAIQTRNKVEEIEIEPKTITDDELSRGSKAISQADRDAAYNTYIKEVKELKDKEIQQEKINALIDEENDALAKGSKLMDEKYSGSTDVKKINQDLQNTYNLANRFGNVFSSAFSKAIPFLKQTDNLLVSILQQIAEMIVQAATVGIIMSMIPGAGGFMAGFKGALGIKGASVLGSDPTQTLPISNPVIPSYANIGGGTIRLQLEPVQLTGRGRDLNGIIQTDNLVLSRYYK